eukprot:TRINITY_DN32489_c0_g2_i1.p2 TRINITY_DN32489_c0_g2~~TRINITY_DN32489_c0_g2_i1.p2  ORF type:complete len:115 (-),score=6.76 TRINITY_DN32489_c0_g2_i1:364-708(-)
MPSLPTRHDFAQFKWLIGFRVSELRSVCIFIVSTDRHDFLSGEVTGLCLHFACPTSCGLALDLSMSEQSPPSRLVPPFPGHFTDLQGCWSLPGLGPDVGPLPESTPDTGSLSPS